MCKAIHKRGDGSKATRSLSHQQTFDSKNQSTVRLSANRSRMEPSDNSCSAGPVRRTWQINQSLHYLLVRTPPACKSLNYHLRVGTPEACVPGPLATAGGS